MAENWLDVPALATLDVTTERDAHTLRLHFDKPQAIRRIQLRFEERERARTHEFVLRYSTGAEDEFRDIVRQQWNFSPEGATEELEDYRVELSSVTVLELRITPDIGGGKAIAGLTQLRLA